MIRCISLDKFGQLGLYLRHIMSSAGIKREKIPIQCSIRTFQSYDNKRHLIAYRWGATSGARNQEYNSKKGFGYKSEDTDEMHRLYMRVNYVRHDDKRNATVKCALVGADDARWPKVKERVIYNRGHWFVPLKKYGNITAYKRSRIDVYRTVVSNHILWVLHTMASSYIGCSPTIRKSIIFWCES